MKMTYKIWYIFSKFSKVVPNMPLTKIEMDIAIIIQMYFKLLRNY
jgi:hypothetical protein